jgi:uncharacterized damage-inducible protein DinB
MKYFFQLMADYNAQANRRMYQIIRNTPEYLLTKDNGSYFDNLLGLLNHHLWADIGWLKGYRDSDVQLEALQNPVLDIGLPGWKANITDDLDELWEIRQEVDKLFLKFTREVSEEALLGAITLTRRDKKMRFIFHEVLMHLFNHQTHHRGSIALALDQEGVENDFSNLLDVLNVETV